MPRKSRSAYLSPSNSANSRYVTPEGRLSEIREWEEKEWPPAEGSDVANSMAAAAFEGSHNKRESLVSYDDTYSKASFLDVSPKTPSPILSPFTSFLSSPPSVLCSSTPSAPLSTRRRNRKKYQCSCIGSNNYKKSVLTENKVKPHNYEQLSDAKASHNKKTLKWHHYEQLSGTKSEGRRTDIDDKEGERLKGDRRGKAKSIPQAVKTSQQQLSVDKESITAWCDGQVSHHHPLLPTIIQEQEEREPLVASPTLITGRYATSLPADGYSESKCGEKMENGREVNEHRRSVGGLPHGATGNPFSSQMTTKEMEAELHAWKESQTQKLFAMLTKQESKINAWQFKETSKAKINLKKLESKMAKKREKAYKKMEEKLKRTKKKAEKKKEKERQAMIRKFSELSIAVENVNTTRRFPWMLGIC